MWGNALARDDERRRQEQQQMQYQQHAPPPMQPPVPPPPPATHYAPTQQSYPPPQQQPLLQQQSYYQDQEEYYGGEDDNGALTAGINMFASAASTIFTQGSAAAKKLASKGQQAASQIATAAAPPPNQPPMVYPAYGQPPQHSMQPPAVFAAVTQQPQYLVPETSMLSTPAIQPSVINQRVRHGMGGMEQFGNQQAPSRSASPAAEFFAAPLMEQQNHFAPPVALPMAVTVPPTVVQPPQRSESPAAEFFASQTPAHFAPSQVATSHAPPFQPLQRSASPAAILIASQSPPEPQFRPPAFPASQPAAPQLQPLQRSASPAADFFASQSPLEPQFAPPVVTVPQSQVFAAPLVHTQVTPQPPAAAFFAAPSPAHAQFQSAPPAVDPTQPAQSPLPVQIPSPAHATAQRSIVETMPVPISAPSLVVAAEIPAVKYPVVAQQAPAFPPPRPTPMSRFTPPSSPRVADTIASRTPLMTKRKLNLPLPPRRQPLSLPRPATKSPSPRTSPRVNKRWGGFKKPTPAKSAAGRSLPSTPILTKMAQVKSPQTSPVAQIEPQVIEAVAPAVQESPKGVSVEEAEVAVSPNPAPLSASLQKPLLVAGWSEQIDSNTGKADFVNSITNETSLDLPNDEGIPEAPPTLASSAVEEKKEATAELAIEVVGESVDDDVPQPVVFDSSIADLPSTASILSEEWMEQEDLSSGRISYYNSLTQDTSWEGRSAAAKAFAVAPEVTGGDEPVTEDAVTSVSKIVEELVDTLAEARITERQISESSQQGVLHSSSFVAGSPINGSEDKSTVTNEVGWESPARKVDYVTSPRTVEEMTPLAIGKNAVEALLSAAPPAIDEPMSEPRTSDTLADGWTEIEDPSSGSVYYFNTLTQETSWERPTITDNSLANLQSVTAEEMPVVVIEDTVESVLDTIEKPIDEDLPEPEVVDEAVSNKSTGKAMSYGWIEVADPGSGSVYYYNTATQETSWERSTAPTDLPADPEPVEEQDSSALKVAADIFVEALPQQKVEDEQMAQPSTEGLLPEGWTEVEDPTTESIYYYNTRTQETSWEWPPHSTDLPARAELVMEESIVVDEAVAEPVLVAAEVPILADLSEPALGEPLPEGWTEVADSGTGSVYYYNTVTQETSWERPTIPTNVPVDTEPVVEEGSIAVERDALKPVLNISEELPEPAVDESVTQPLAVTGELPEGWTEVEDPSSGSIYYYNTLTQETIWETPAFPEPVEKEEAMSFGDDAVEPTHSSAESVEKAAGREMVEESTPELPNTEALAESWTEVVDPSSDTVYYYNTLTQETSWERPTVPTELPADPKPVAAEELADVDEDLSEPMRCTTKIEDLHELVDRPVSESVTSETLAEGWTKAVDPSSGSVYYYNTLTQETSWERPTVPTDLPAGPKPVADEGIAADDEDLSERVHGTTEIEEEPGVADEPLLESLSSEALAEGWTEVEDSSDGSIYYYNTMTQGTSWERPTMPLVEERIRINEDSVETVIDTVVTSVEGNNAEPEMEDEPLSELFTESLPESWIEVEDPGSGGVYYYNTTTQETSWERPRPIVLFDSAVAVNQDPSPGEEVVPISTHAALEPLDTRGAEPEISTSNQDYVTEIVASGTDDPETEVAEEEYVMLPGSQNLLSGWASGVDPSSGKMFYFNGDTGETSWDLPVAVPQSSASEELQPEITNVPTPSSGSPAMLALVESSPEETPKIHIVQEPENTTNHDYESVAIGSECARPLPDSWVEEVDPNTGQRLYYFNTVTKKTSWERPTGCQPIRDELLEVSEPDDSSAKPEITTTLPESARLTFNNGEGNTMTGAWTEQVDGSSGNMYYYNTLTQQTSWDKPVVDTTVPEPRQAPDIRVPTTIPENDCDEDQVSNTIEDEGAKELPVVVTSMATLDLVPAEERQIDATMQESGQTQWSELVDPYSGKTYYYNETTGQTTWECPDEPLRLDSGDDTLEKNKTTGENQSESIYDTALPHVDSDPTAVLQAAAISITDFVQPIRDAIPENNPVHEQVSSDPVAEQVIENPESQVEAEQKMVLAEGWIETVDASSGKCYYFNESTAQTTWDRPTIEPDETSMADELPETIAPPFTNEITLAPSHLESPEPEGDSNSAVSQSTKDSVTKDSVSDRELFEGWAEVIDPDSGEVYYFNEATNETAWERPGVDDSPDIIVQEMSDEVESPSQPKDEYFVEDVVSNEIEQAEELEQLVVVLPMGWTERVDPGTGNVYYYNKDDGTTSWEVPIANAGTPEADSSVPPLANEEPPLPLNSSEDIPVPKIEGESIAVQKDLKSSDLSNGWVEVFDESSGQPYYLNEAGGLTTWEKPITAAAEDGTGDTIVEENELDSFVGNADRDPIEVKAAQLSTKQENCDEASSNGNLLDGWVQVIDPTSENVYYVNEVTNATTWDRSVAEAINTQAVAKISNPGGRSRSLHAFASFGFGGKLCIFRAKNVRQLELHKVNELVPSHPVVQAEKSKQGFGIVGALNEGESASVSSYIAAQANENPYEFLWSLIQIASQSEGRLRSDEGVADTSSPESLVIQLLLQADSTTEGDAGREEIEKFIDEESKAESLQQVESLLLHGKREEAVQEAISGHHFAMALLVASMCDRTTFQNATKSFAEEILSSGSPLHTLALLFSGQLEPTPDSVLDRSGMIPAVWSDTTDELRNSWRQHLCAVISNRMLGWDRIVLSLGDRLLELGDVHAAHCCYMVCGCAVSSLLHPTSRMCIVGCDHLVPMDASLMTDDSVAAYSRSEAYEWAKRRGNPEASIQSLQAFKLSYAMILSDLGYDEAAERYVESIRRCAGLKKKAVTDFDANGKPATMWTFSEALELSRFIDIFDERLSYRKNPLHSVALDAQSPIDTNFATKRGTRASGGNKPSKRLSSTPPVISIPDNHVDMDISMLSAKSAAFEKSPRPVAAIKKLSDMVGAPVRAGSNSQSAQQGLPPSSTLFSLHNATPSKPTTALMKGPQPSSMPPSQPGSIFPSTQSRGLPSAGSGPPQNGPVAASSMPLIMPPSASALMPPSGPPMMTASMPHLHPLSAASMPTPSEKKQPSSPPKTAETKRKKPERAPSSAPADLQGSNKTLAKAPTSAQKRAWGIGGLRDWMTKRLNPDATTADLGGGMEAYYDEKLKRWIFPGDDPAEVAKPLAPPPTMTPKKEVAAQEEKSDASLDPLAAMMAPPPRSVRRSTARPASTLTPSMMMMPPVAGMFKTSAAAIAQPSFMVFTPKATETKKEESKGEPAAEE